jgi:predicted N-acetyltransferase YhbS
MKRIHIVPIDEASKPKPSGKAFLLPGSYSPYTIGHHEMARQAAAHAASTGHAYFYHGIGAASKQSADDPLTHGQKRSVIRSGHRDIAKEHKGMQFHTTEKEHVSPFHQVAHLARQGHKHITIGLGSDQMKEGGVKTAIERHVKKYGGILDKDGKVHKATVSFHQMGAERHEGDMPRHEVLARLRKGDMSVAKAGRLRKAVASGDTELAHELMPKHINKPKYFSLIQKQQARVAKPKKKALVKEGCMSFLDFIGEDIELTHSIGRNTVEPTKHFGSEYLKKKEATTFGGNQKFLHHKNLGEFHPNYELHRHSYEERTPTRDGVRKRHIHDYSIVHKPSNTVVGGFVGNGGKVSRKSGFKEGKGDDVSIINLHIHPTHSKKKIGASLPVQAYKHLHKLGHSVESGSLQSPGGAHVWNTLRKDPEVKKHVRYHDPFEGRSHAAHKLPTGEIWQDEQDDRTLILHRKPKKKALVAERYMSFLDFIAEAPEIDPYIDPPSGSIPKFKKEYIDQKKHTRRSEDKYTSHRNLGEIHPNYELHRHTVKTMSSRPYHSHRFSIVHKATGDVAGEIDATGGKIDRKTGEHTRGTGKGLTIDWIHVHPKHGTKKIGTSLAAAAYKHMHKLGHSIKAGKKQSVGGAHIWDKLRHDPEVDDHVKVHDELYDSSTPAHKLSHGEIWRDDERGQDKSIVLHAKPKKKSTVSEDIELIPVHRDTHVEKRKAADVHKAYGSKTYSSDKVVKRKNLGQIHPGYDLHQHSVEINTGRGDERAVKHKFTIVHKASGDVAGEMHAWGGKLHPVKGVIKGTKGKGLKVSHLEVHPDHREKKIGTSLPVEMYRHLHRRGHAIQSDANQSHGAANVWNTMRHDRELQKHMMIHDSGGAKNSGGNAFEPRAYRRPERHIWYQHSRSWSHDRGQKVEPSFGDEPETVKTLILSGKKRKKKTVKEDIEMADVSQKPTTSKHALRWKTRADLPKSKASRLTKGYTIHTFHGPHDSPKNPVTQYHTIVHDASGDVVGELETARRERGGNMEHAVTSTRIHADHTQKKIGKSLALAAYKHLAKTRILSSSILQSPGGASVWNRLRKDPKLKGRVFHHSTSGVVPAHDIPDKMIWAHETKVTKSKGTPESLPPSKRHASEHSKVLGSRLTIRPLQKS